MSSSLWSIVRKETHVFDSSRVLWGLWKRTCHWVTYWASGMVTNWVVLDSQKMIIQEVRDSHNVISWQKDNSGNDEFPKCHLLSCLGTRECGHKQVWSRPVLSSCWWPLFVKPTPTRHHNLFFVFFLASSQTIPSPSTVSTKKVRIFIFIFFNI